MHYRETSEQAPEPPKTRVHGFSDLLGDYVALSSFLHLEPMASAGLLQLPTPVVPNATPELTQYAKRYGVSEDELYEGTGKSGITPLSPPPNLADLSEKNRKIWNKYAEYQRKEMSSYTSWELKDVGALVEGNVETDGLAFCSVHDFFRKERWAKAKNDTKIGEGFKGKWNAANPAVWEAILPSIKLASLIWVNANHFLWMDALWNGKRVKVPNKHVQADGGPPDVVFALFPRDVSMRGTAGTPRHLESWINNFPIKFSLIDGLRGGMSVNGLTKAGWDQKRGYPEGFRVGIAWQNVIPLLRKDTTPSERLAQQFLVAKTLVHECCHVMAGLSVTPLPNSTGPPPEPFYQEEPMSEAGWSNEQAVWGGMITPIISRRKTPRHTHIRPAMALERSNFPSFEQFKRGKCRIFKPSKKGNPRYDYKRYRHHDKMLSSKSQRTSWAIPVYWLENVQTEEYWTHTVAKYGGPALRPPAIAGRTFYKGKKEQGALTLGADFGTWIEIKGGKMTALDLPDTGDGDEDTFWWEARRRVRGFAIRVAERQRVEWRMEWCGKGGGVGEGE